MSNGQDARNTRSMLTEIYVEALLVDEELADQVWEAWSSFLKFRQFL